MSLGAFQFVGAMADPTENLLFKRKELTLDRHDNAQRGREEGVCAVVVGFGKRDDERAAWPAAGGRMSRPG